MSNLYVGIRLPERWRLFIGSSKTSVKAALLNSGNEKTSVPIAQKMGVGKKETQKSMDLILKLMYHLGHN